MEAEFAAPSADGRGRPGKRWCPIEPDELRGLVPLVLVFGAYFALDRITARLAPVSPERLDEAVLLLGAVRSNRLEALFVAVAVVAAMVLRRDRVGVRWVDLEHGTALRGLVAPLVVLLAWQYSLYELNFLLDRTHLLDRALIVALAVGCLWRPALVLPFVVQVRIVASQFEVPFGTLAAQNIDELLLIVLLAVAATHLVHVIFGTVDTAPVVLLIVAAVVSHFWVPGKAKVELGWLATDVSNLPLAAYTAGWQGHGDGGWAQRMSDLADRFDPAMKPATLLIELGAPLVILVPRLLRWWLPAVVTFHAILFAFTGYWFLTWVVLEIGLLVLLTRPHLKPWLDRNGRARRLVAATAVVIGGSVLFHPPSLAWLDAPVSYGIQVEVVGESGRRYSAPAAQFAPLEQELTFLRLELGGRPRATGAYGAVTSGEALESLEAVSDFAELEAYEEGFDASPLDPWAEEYFTRFLRRAAEGERSPWRSVAPPDHFWTSGAAPTFGFDEPASGLEVRLATSLHAVDAPPRLETLLVLELDGQGRVQRVVPEPAAGAD